MGIYLNPNNVNFSRDLASEIYIDKSMLLSVLNKMINTNRNLLCVSRPRRFGKSMAENMMAAYYSKGADSRSLFAELKFGKDSSFEKYLNKCNVIMIDMNGMFNNKESGYSTVKFFTKAIAAELRDAFPMVEIRDTQTLPDMIGAVYQATGEQFIIIIDEYDVLVREKVSRDEFAEYLQFLNGMFKNANLLPAIMLAYMTGILPIVRDKIQSKLNNFKEYTMLGAGSLTEFVGFTEDETRSLCERYNMDFAECRRWFNGYHLKDMDIYNPNAVVTAMLDGEYGNYWAKTGSYEALKDYILMNFDGIKDDVVAMLGGKRVKVEVMSYLNTMTDFAGKDDVFTYLIHLGYLAYDSVTKSCYIPNYEIRCEWVIAIKESPDYAYIMKMINASEELLEATLECDESAVAAALDNAHSVVMNNLSYNKEACFQSAIVLSYFYARSKYTIVTELPTGKGYADVAFIPFVPNVPAIIIELKNTAKATAETALDQIKSKQYFVGLEHYSGDILLVGVSYDPENKEHQCRIEKFIKE